MLVREDARGWAYRFVNLTAAQFGRLQSLVAEFAVRPAAPPANSPRVERQSGTLRIVRRSGTDAASGEYSLTFDSPSARLKTRQSVTDDDLLGALTTLRVSPEARVNTMLKLAISGSISLHLSVTEDELRQVGFKRS